MRIASTLAAILLCSVSGASVWADDWVEFRGPTGQGLATATGLPVRWSATENVAWRAELPGKAWSSPILLKGRVYMTTAVPLDSRNDAPQSLRAICLDAAGGDLLWNVEVFRQPAGVTIHGKNSHASATPVTDGRRLFVHFGTHGTAALELDGNILWKNQDLKYDPRHGSGGSPVLVDGLLVVSCDGLDVQFVTALDQETGRIRWKTPRNTNTDKGFSFCTPLVIDVAGRQQLVSSGSDAVFAYDPHDGSELWKVAFPGGFSVVPRPVYGNGLLFVCTGYNTPSLLAIRPEGAIGDVTETHVAWRSKKSIPNNPSPLLIDNALYLITDNGVATCLDAMTGRQRWQNRIGGDFSASPVFADGKIYLQSEEGEGVVLKANPDAYEELARNALEERTLASYAIAERALYVRSDRALVCIQSNSKD